MDNYYFFYLDAADRWHRATNPIFIAMHRHCRAVPKAVIDEAYSLVNDFLMDLNKILEPESDTLKAIRIKYDLRS